MVKFPSMREAHRILQPGFGNQSFVVSKGKTSAVVPVQGLRAYPNPGVGSALSHPLVCFWSRRLLLGSNGTGTTMHTWQTKVCSNVQLRGLWRGCGQTGGAARNWWTGSGRVIRAGLDRGVEEQRASRWTSGRWVKGAGVMSRSCWWFLPGQVPDRRDRKHQEARRGNRDATPTVVNRGQNMGPCGN